MSNQKVVGQNEEGYDIVQHDLQHWSITHNGVKYIHSTLSTATQTRISEYPVVFCPKQLKYILASSAV